MLANAALSFARRGLHVFPLMPMSKLPAISKTRGGNGCLDATNDVSVIAKWWHEQPRCNVGLATGEKSGLWVLDIDTKDDGFTALKKLEAQYGALPDTRMASTPTGGVHFFWKWNPDIPIKNSTGRIAKGIDTRGKGGYVVAPPSVREEGEYVWISETPMTDAPGWLIGLCAIRQEQARPASSTIKPPTHEDAMKLLDRLAPWRADNYGAWTSVGMALAELGNEGLSLWDNWSRKSPKYAGGECERKWPTFEPEGIKFGSLVFWANEDSPMPKTKRGAKMTSAEYGAIINGTY